MNPIRQQQQPMSFNEFAQSMTPDAAKAQLEQMVRSGQISETQLQQAMALAKQLAPQLGIKI